MNPELIKDSFLGIIGAFGNIAARDNLNDRKSEMLCKIIVAAVVGRNRHDGAGSVSCQHIIRHPDGNRLVVDGIDAVCTGEYTGTFFTSVIRSRSDRFFAHCRYSSTALFSVGGSDLFDVFMFGSQHHEGCSENGIGTCGEDIETEVCILDGEHDLGTFRTADPVALDLFQRFRPFDGFESVEQALGIGRDPQEPLPHQFAFNRVAAANGKTVHYFIIGQDGTQFRAPVHHRIRQVSQAVIHQDLLLLLFCISLPQRVFRFEFCNQFANGPGLLHSLSYQ